MQLSASILACNSLKIAQNIIAAKKGGTDVIHIDIMDGNYVENLTYGPGLISDLKEFTDLPLEVHLELSRPDRFIDMFARAGADRIVVQRDSLYNPIRLLEKIRTLGIKAGIGLNPADDVSSIKYLLKHVDFIVLMSVEPGFGGQIFNKSCFNKVEELKQEMKNQELNLPIVVDGGINVDYAKKLEDLGVSEVIVGESLFGSNDIKKTAEQFKSI